MASQAGGAPAGQKKPKSRIRGKQRGKSDAEPASGIDFDILVMGTAPVVTDQDHIVTSPTQEVTRVKRRRFKHT